MDSADEDTFIVALICEESERRLQRPKRKWVHEICKKRMSHGEYHTLFPYLLRDDKRFFEYFRMTQSKFQNLLNLVNDGLLKEDTSFRMAISPEERLVVCLRFLITGDSFRTIAFTYRMGHTTVRTIVHETCAEIWKKLSPLVLPVPDRSMWKSIELGFNEKWNFPNCIGAMDGKHITIESPSNSGSLYFNYKKTFSVVLMALVDADYKFMAIDVGAYGKTSDSGILSNSPLGQAIDNGTFNIPEDKPLPGNSNPVLHVIVGDEAFPLERHIMRPYPGSQIKDDEAKRVFNYRPSRARRISENAFGILTQKFRIYNRRLKMKVEHVDNVILATCCLHNFLRTDEILNLTQTADSDSVPVIGTIQNTFNNATNEAINVRETFKNDFVSEEGSVPWQTEMIRRGSGLN